MTSWITYVSSIAIGTAGGGSGSAAREAGPRRWPKPGWSALAALLAAAPAVAAGPDDKADTRLLSPAQIALLETPHLENIDHPETLQYRYRRDGAGAFTDSIAERIEKIHTDGTKYVGFSYLTGEHNVFFPAVDNFRGNPLLMVFLEQDVRELRDETGI